MNPPPHEITARAAPPSSRRTDPLREVRWECMFRDELDVAIGERPVLYLPYGICEPHGPGNVLGLDGLAAHGLACAAARAHGGIVAPAWFWHIAEIGGDGAWCHAAIGQVERSWFTSFPPWMFFRAVCYHVRAAEAMRFQAAILYTGHGGPLEQDLRRLAGLLQPHVGVRLAAATVSGSNPSGFFDGSAHGHADKHETSILWALEPAGVDPSRLPPGKTGPDFAMAANIYEANRRVGERMVAEAVDWLGRKADELLAEFERVRPNVRMDTFAAVERFWDREVRPILPGFMTMQDLWEGQEPVPPDSCWYGNWHVPAGVS